MGGDAVGANQPDRSTGAFSFQDVGLHGAAGEQILSGISWRLSEGAVGVLVGPSGSGKTRLLRMLNRLDEPSAGVVSVFGRPLDRWEPRELRTTVGWVPQSPALSAGTARHNLTLPVRLGVVSEEQFRDRVEAARGVAGLTDAVLDRTVSKLSGGERQRVAIARALVLAPRLLLMDEPTAGLDGAAAAAMLAALLEWRAAAAATLVVVTHRLADVRALDGELLMLEGGCAVTEGVDDDRLRALLAGEGV